MSEVPPKIVIDAKTLGAARAARAAKQEAERAALEAKKARLARAFASGGRAADAPAPVVHQADPEKLVRTVALGIGAFVTFLPAALLADVAEGVRGGGSPASLAKNVLALVLLTLVPAFLSAAAEVSPDAQEARVARFVKRFCVVLPGGIAALSLAFPYVIRWTAVELALVAQAPLAYCLQVPRVRAIHALVTGWGALASALLDDRAIPSLLVWGASVVVAAVLDRATFAREVPGSRRAPSPGFALRVAALVLVLGGSLFALALALLPPGQKTLPEVRRVRLTRPEHPVERTSNRDVFVGLAIAAGLIFVYQKVAARLRPGKAGKPHPEAIPGPAGAAVSIDRAVPSVPPWPEGPRRSLVAVYLAHLAALARRGLGRGATATPEEHAERVGRAQPSVAAEALRVSAAFAAARYSAGEISAEQVARAEADVKRIEGALEPPA